MTSIKIAVKDYVGANGRIPFADWFKKLDKPTSRKVYAVLTRIEEGNMPILEHVGEGVWECRIHVRGGIRIYLGMDGETLVILLGGGTKRRQSDDIKAAKARWQEYKNRK